MRKIKFRAWDGKKMLEPEDLSVAPDHRKWLGHKDLPLMQFTGMVDQDGVEIYEGDFIVVPDTYVFYDDGKLNYVGVVEFIFGAWQYVLHRVNTDKAGISSGINYMIDDDGEGGVKFKVIGNIYELIFDNQS